MAALFESDGKEEKFLGFPEEHESGSSLHDSESDISVSTVNTQDFNITDLETKVVVQEWNSNCEAVKLIPLLKTLRQSPIFPVLLLPLISLN